MKRLEFEDYLDFACEVENKLNRIVELDKFNDIAIIAKFEEMRQIIKSLVCIGYDIHSLEIHAPEWNGYKDEYICSICNNDEEKELWCEPYKRESGYFTDKSSLIYVLDNCSSACLGHLKSNIILEVCIGEDATMDSYNCEECTCRIDDKPKYNVKVKCALDADEALEIIKDMKKRITRMNDAFIEMDRFRRLFDW